MRAITSSRKTKRVSDEPVGPTTKKQTSAVPEAAIAAVALTTKKSKATQTSAVPEAAIAAVALTSRKSKATQTSDLLTAPDAVNQQVCMSLIREEPHGFITPSFC